MYDIQSVYFVVVPFATLPSTSIKMLKIAFFDVKGVADKNSFLYCLLIGLALLYLYMKVRNYLNMLPGQKM